MKIMILHFFLYFTFLLLGAYATTDILRLLKGSATPVNAPDCHCPKCGYRIPLTCQIPVFSYIWNKGKCRGCHAPIPFTDLFLELFLFMGCSVISTALRFSWISYAFCILLYEGTKLLFLLRMGAREDRFAANLLISLRNNALFFLLLAFLFALCHCQ